MKNKNTKEIVKKKKKKGFTLIELLAVIIILGILMVIAVPAVTKYISDSRKNSYINSAKGIINGARTLTNSEDLDMTREDTTYYIPAKYIKTESGLKTPYGEFTEAYIGVINDGKRYKYYWISNDTSGQGIKNITYQDGLDIDQIEENLIDTEIKTTVEETGIEDRNKILILNLDGTWQDERIAKYNLNENGETEPADTLLAVFLPGTDFIKKIKVLGNNSSATYDMPDTAIKYLKKSSVEPTDINKQEKNVVSTSDSEVPIYAWFDNGTLYWWSEDYKPNLNENANFMFYNLQGLKDIELDKIKTNITTSMLYMFGNCKDLETLDVSKFDTSRVKNMAYMFYIGYRWGSGSILSNLKEIIGLEKFDTSNVTNMANIFHGQRMLESINVSSFDTSKVVYMYGMFGNCHSLKSIDVSHFDTRNVINMGTMFQHTTALKKIDISNFDTSKVTEMTSMFGCGGNRELCQLVEIKGLDKMNTSNVEHMGGMFVHQTKLRTLDLSSFDTRKVVDTDYMFYGTNLTTIYVSSKFDLSSVTNSDYMFYKALNSVVGVSTNYVLTGGAGTTYDESHIDKEYARIDDPANGRPGYFTLKTN